MGRGAVISAVDRLTMDSTVEINGKAYAIRHLVELGKASGNRKTRELSQMLEGDLSSDVGLLIGFPIAFLYEALRAEGALLEVYLHQERIAIEEET